MISVSYCNLVKRTDNGNKRVHLKSCMFTIDENGQLLVEDSSFFLWNKNSKLLGSTYSYTITYSPNSQSQSRSTFLMVVGMLFTQKRDLKLHKMQQPWPDGSSIKPIQMSNSCQSLNMRSWWQKGDWIMTKITHSKVCEMLVVCCLLAAVSQEFPILSIRWYLVFV